MLIVDVISFVVKNKYIKSFRIKVNKIQILDTVSDAKCFYLYQLV